MSIGVIILLCFVRSTVAASSAPLPPTDLGRLSLLMRSEMEKVKEKVCQTCMTGCMDPGVTMKKIVVPNSVEALTFTFEFDDMRLLCLPYCKHQVRWALDLYVENIGHIRGTKGSEAFVDSDISLNQGYARQQINKHYLCGNEDNLGSLRPDMLHGGDGRRVEIRDPEDDQNQKFSMSTLTSSGNGALNSAWRGFLQSVGGPFSTRANDNGPLPQPLWSKGGTAGMRWARPRR